jgi:hypothetical protein
MRPLAALSFASILQATWEFLIMWANLNILSPTDIQGKRINLFQFELPGTGEWRPSRHVLVMYLDIYRIRIYHCVVVGNGFDSTYRWRPIPLGIGVFLASIPEISQLHYWLDVRTGMAIWNCFWIFPHRHHHSGIDQCPQSELWCQRLQGTLLVFLMVLVSYIFNVYASELMPILSNVLMILHVLSRAVILIVLWAMSPHRSAEAVFVSDWQNLGGLSTMGLNAMVG